MSTRARRKEAAPYHHGDLRRTLIEAAQTILQREGIQALSLRACAREAGVTHAAPAHHFPTLVALLSEVAAEGYDALSEALERELQKGLLDARPGHTYVEFAKQNQNLFLLMSDSSRLESSNPMLEKARRRGLRALSGNALTSLEHLSLEQVVEMSARWSFVHGLSVLMLTGRLKSLLDLSPQGTTRADLVDATLGYMRHRLSRKDHE